MLKFLKSFKQQSQFETLLEPYMDHLFRLAYRFSCNVDDAEDLVQDLMAKIYPKRSNLKNTPQFKNWLSKVLYHLYIDGVRKNSTQAQFFSFSDASLDDFANPDPSVENVVHSMGSQKNIESAYFQLPSAHRVVLSMHDMEGYTLIEMEQILDTPLGTLKSRLHRARANMKKLLLEKN